MAKKSSRNSQKVEKVLKLCPRDIEIPLKPTKEGHQCLLKMARRPHIVPSAPFRIFDVCSNHFFGWWEILHFVHVKFMKWTNGVCTLCRLQIEERKGKKKEIDGLIWLKNGPILDSFLIHFDSVVKTRCYYNQQNATHIFCGAEINSL